MGMIRDGVFLAILLLFVAVLTIKFSPHATGYTVFDNNVDYFIQEENLEETQGLYNENIEAIPNFIKTIINNEKVNLMLDDNKGGLDKIKFETKSGEIQGLSTGVYEKPTIIIYSDVETLQTIKDSDQIVSAIQTALGGENIVIEAITYKAKVKTGAANILTKIWSWFD